MGKTAIRLAALALGLALVASSASRPATGHAQAGDAGWCDLASPTPPPAGGEEGACTPPATCLVAVLDTVDPIYPGDYVHVELHVENARDLHAAWTECRVDSAVLRPQQTTTLLGSSAFALAERIDSTRGTWSGGIRLPLADTLSGDYAYARMWALASGPGATSVECRPRFTDLEGSDLAVTFVPAGVTVLPFAAIAGSAVCPDRRDPADVEVRVTGPDVRLAWVGGDGAFGFDGLRAGGYGVHADAVGCLPACTSIALAPGDAVDLGPITLVGGDANGDGRIDAQDVALVEADLGLAVPPGDPWADANGDGAVDEQDLAVVRDGYGLAGCQAWLPKRMSEVLVTFRPADPVDFFHR